MHTMRLLLAASVLFALGCSRNESSSNPLFGTWEAVSGEAMGKEIKGKETWGMRITFSADKAVWHFNTPEGEKSYEGYCRIDASKSPAEIDLRQPKSDDPDRTALGIYKVEGNSLRISMGKERPRDFDEPALTKLVFERMR